MIGESTFQNFNEKIFNVIAYRYMKHRLTTKL